jgi:hypothetical protein
MFAAEYDMQVAFAQAPQEDRNGGGAQFSGLTIWINLQTNFTSI